MSVATRFEISGSRVQHGHAQHGGAEHGLAQHGHTKVLQVRAREHLMRVLRLMRCDALQPPVPMLSRRIGV